MKKRRQRGRTVPAAQPDQPVANNPYLRSALLEVVDTQLETGDPPLTRETLERLVRLGYTREGARELIATVVLNEIFTVMKRGEPYDAARYSAALARLPELPDDDYAES